MCNGIAVIIYERNGKLNGLCTGVSSHDELCKLDDDLRYGVIEPWRFELLYPQNLVYDRGYNKKTETGLFNEQPSQAIWDVADQVSKTYHMKHNKNQLRFATLRNANLSYADLSDADLIDADLRNADLRNADLIDANLSGADLRNADLSDEF